MAGIIQVIGVISRMTRNKNKKQPNRKNLRKKIAGESLKGSRGTIFFEVKNILIGQFPFWPIKSSPKNSLLPPYTKIGSLKRRQLRRKTRLFFLINFVNDI